MTKKQISLFDDEKFIRLSTIDEEYGSKFELTDDNMQKCHFTESQLLSLREMIEEMIQIVNKRDYL